MRDVVIVSAARTPVAKFQGSLAGFRAPDLGGLAIAVMILVSISASRRQRRATSTPDYVPSILVHSINDDRCTGCDACVAVCPTNVLDLVDNKSRVLRFQDCIQCEACMWACPTEALVMHMEGKEPPRLKVPDLDDYYQTAIPGQYLIGEVAGKPLEAGFWRRCTQFPAGRSWPPQDQANSAASSKISGGASTSPNQCPLSRISYGDLKFRLSHLHLFHS